MGEDFYEDDEPVEKIRDAFAKGEKGKTMEPRVVVIRWPGLCPVILQRLGDRIVLEPPAPFVLPPE